MRMGTRVSSMVCLTQPNSPNNLLWYRLFLASFLDEVGEDTEKLSNLSKDDTANTWKIMDSNLCRSESIAQALEHCLCHILLDW